MTFLAGLAPLAGAASGATSAIGTALSVIGTGVGVISQISANNARARMAKENAARAEESAQMQQQSSQIEQQQKDAETSALLGQLDASQSASGLSTLGSSFSLVRRRAQALGRQDALNIRAKGDSVSRNYLNQAADYRAEAADAKRSNIFAVLGGVTKIGTTLIGGASPVSSRYDAWRGLR